MKKIVVVVIGWVSLLVCPMAQAQLRDYTPAPDGKTHSVWGRNENKRTGLYARRNATVGQGAAVSVDALYYYGDVDNMANAFKSGWHMTDAMGARLSLSYTQPWGLACNGRYTLSGGYLHGNDTSRVTTSGGVTRPGGKGLFHNGFAEAEVGVECYPFRRIGLYLYVGVAANVSVISYDFSRADAGVDRAVRFAPIIPIEIGYHWAITPEWFLGVHASLHQAVVDVPLCSLDAWPLTEKQSAGDWPDGYFSLGLTATYRWRR